MWEALRISDLFPDYNSVAAPPPVMRSEKKPKCTSELRELHVCGSRAATGHAFLNREPVHTRRCCMFTALCVCVCVTASMLMALLNLFYHMSDFNTFITRHCKIAAPGGSDSLRVYLQLPLKKISTRFTKSS